MCDLPKCRNLTLRHYCQNIICEGTRLVTDKELVYYVYVTVIVKSWSFCVTFV